MGNGCANIMAKFFDIVIVGGGPAGSLCTFERMGVKEKIDQADVIVKYGGKIVSACGTRSNRFLFSDVFRCSKCRKSVGACGFLASWYFCKSGLP